MIEPSETDVSGLLRKVGPRAVPTLNVTTVVYQSTLHAWRREVRRRRVTRIALAMAVCLVLALAGSWIFQRGNGDDLVAIVSGSSGKTLRIGERLSSEENEVRLARVDGVIMRLAPHSAIVAASHNDVALERGSLYVETGPTANYEAKFRLITPYATVDHLGTQFVATLGPSGMQIAVRQGKLTIHTRQGEVRVIEAHDSAKVNKNGESARLSNQGADALWQWVNSDTLTILEGRTLYAVLVELSQRDGLALRFSEADVSSRAQGYVLHGPSLAVSPQVAINIVAASAGLRAQIVDQSLLIQPL